MSGLAKMLASFLIRPPARSVSRPRRPSVQPPCQRSWSSYVRGYPCPGRVSTLLNQTYSTPLRLVHACLQVTEQVWQPMHLSRFITMAICAIGLMSRSAPWASVPHLLAAAADHRHLVALAAGRAQVVEREAELGVAADQVGRLDQQPGERVVDAAAPAAGLGDRHVDDPFLGVVHEDRPLGHAMGDDRAGDHDAVAVHRLDPVVVGDPGLPGVLW